MKHLEAFVFLACFLFTVVFSDVGSYIAVNGVFGCTVTLLMKSFVAVYFPVWAFRWLISKLWRKRHV